MGDHQRVERPSAVAQPATAVEVVDPVRSVATVQPMLEVGPSDDPLEREADQVAALVVRSLRSGAVLAGSSTPPVAVDAVDGKAPVNRRVQRSAAAASIGREGGTVDAQTDREIRAVRSSGGRPLDPTSRTSMEGAMGADFGRVRVHDGPVARRLNDRIQASAFTTGRDIFFRDGVPDTSTPSGQHLMAHELTHTIQQSGSSQTAVGDGPVGRIRRAAPRVQRLVTQTPWNTASAVSAPGGGAKGGIFFVTVGGVRHVVKATSQAAGAVFGERIVGQIMGTSGVSATSIPVPNTDAEFASILAQLRRYQPAVPNQGYNDRLAEFANASTFLIQTDLSTNRTMINANVASDIAILQNAATLRNIGRILAADTLIGNSDRFEQMNVGNAFLGAADIGFIDTEALMQNYQAFNQFSTGPATPTGSPGIAGKGTDFGGAGVNKSQPEAYVDFLTSGGREISDKTFDEAGVAPTPNVTKMATNLKAWFEASFIGKFTAYKPAADVLQFAQAGYPERQLVGDKTAYNNSAWFTFVFPNIKAGFDSGITDISASMKGTGVGALKTSFDQDEQNHGATVNFDFDALLIRGNVMTSIASGTDAEDAKAIAVNYVVAKNGAPSPAMVVAQRVIAFGKQNNILSASDELRLNYFLPSIVDATLRDDILHVRSGASKLKAKAIATMPLADTTYLDNRLEAARAGLLAHFLGQDPFAGLGAAVGATQAMAKATRKADIDQFKYYTDKGWVNARAALDNLGLNGASWMPKR